MFPSFTSGFSMAREPVAGRTARRRRSTFRTGLESLEVRNLLSTAGVADPGAANHAPVLAEIGTQFVQEGNALTLGVTATDPDAGQTLTYSLDPGAPSGASIDPRSGVLTWTPPNVQATYSFAVRVNDNGTPSLGDVKTLTVMVFDVPPGVQAGVNTTIDQGTAFVRSGTFVDPNPDSWTATVDYGDGTGAQPLALGADKTFQLNHTYATPGKYTVLVTINDSQGGQGRGAFAVQVQPVSPTQPAPATLRVTTLAGPASSPLSSGHSPTSGAVASNGETAQNHSQRFIRLHAPRTRGRLRVRPHAVHALRHHH